jgi:hypothetical protein
VLTPRSSSPKCIGTNENSLPFILVSNLSLGLMLLWVKWQFDRTC